MHLTCTDLLLFYHFFNYNTMNYPGLSQMEMVVTIVVMIEQSKAYAERSEAI